jgi:5S rRNA maturation endonuclease (ribonuclease M5)
MSAPLTIERLQCALGGEITAGGTQLLCPGPDHSAEDRSLSIKLDANAPSGFVVHSFAGDDAIACRDYVCAKLSLPKPESKRPSRSKAWTLIAEYIYRQADGTPYLQVRKCTDQNGKKQYPQAHWDGKSWLKGKPDGAKIPYRLPELAAAPVATTVYFVEGEKDADNLAKLGFIATTASEGASAKWDEALTNYFKDRHVVILPDADRPGREHAQKVAKAISAVAASVKIVDFYFDRHDGSDVSDWLVEDSAGIRLARLAKDARPWEPGAEDQSGDDELIAELAKLPPLDYARRREEEASKLSVGVTALDRAVRQHRAEASDDGSALPHWKVEPWDKEVATADLLNGIRIEFEKYIVLPAGAADALALWVLHAWTIDAGDVSPFLVLVSPTKRCGKTSVLIVLSFLTPRSELASNISASALFRYVEETRPTLLIDEADSFLKDNEAMRGILNSGHTKAAAYVIRSVETNGDHKPKRFSTWTPKAIAAIGELADTLQDRAIVLQLQRKSRAAKVARLRKRDCDDFAVLRRKAARWTTDNLVRLTDPEPGIPDLLNDRAADNWRPLLAIAELAGGDWQRRGRDSACVLSGEGHDARSSNVELLADIRRAFGDEVALRSVDLVAKLVADLERPWVEWKNGRALTPKQLGGLLAPFGVTSETVSIAGLADAKGYRRARFEELWTVYLPGQNTISDPSPPFKTSKRRNADVAGTSHDFQSVAEDSGDASKNSKLSNGHAGSDASTLQNSPDVSKGDSASLEEASDDASFGDVPAPAVDPESTSIAPAADHGAAACVQVEPDDIPDLTIPDFLDRRHELDEARFRPGTLLNDDDVAFLESGQFR